MRMSRPAVALTAVVTTALGLSFAVLAPSASASTGNSAVAVVKTSPAAEPGTKSLASVLLADKHGFDRNPQDFDILRSAVLAVLDAKPDSPVKVLTDGDTALTAFLPTDRAFKLLVKDITHAHKVLGEKATFRALAGLGTDTVETVLLYHVIPGQTIGAKTALKSDGAVLTTAQGGTVKLQVQLKYPKVAFVLRDADKNDINPRIVKVNINKGNKQIGHAINHVLRPVDLP